VFVLEVPLAFLSLGVFVATENVFVELHVGAAEGLEEIAHLLDVVHHFFGEIIRVHIYADGSDDAVLITCAPARVPATLAAFAVYPPLSRAAYS
jgi:hypothetical protein